ncbi:MAG: HNH endonuclease [Oscillochloris sp.]|nr:HNH endonuclease [Oscillochloris sp.]
MCGTAIYRRPAEIRSRAVYCSQACFGIACRKERVCPVCGKTFLGDKSNRKTCSRACANVGRTGSTYKHRNNPRHNRAEESRALKKLLLEQRGSKCEICGYSRIEILVVHHIIRRSDGGGNEPENLQLVCPNCHAEIHHRDVKHNIKGSRGAQNRL